MNEKNVQSTLQEGRFFSIQQNNGEAGPFIFSLSS